MTPFLLTVLCAIAVFQLLIPFSNAQADGFGGDASEEQAQQVTLTREAIERLLQSLSSSCRQEVESALAVRGDVSDPCKMEIQEVLRHMNPADLGLPPQGAGEGEGLGADPGYEDGLNEPDPFAGPSRPRRQPTAGANQGWMSPVVAIIIFVVIFFGASAGYVLYYNRTYGDVSAAAAKPKKLSKKKEEKLRQKSSRAGAMIN